MNPALATLAIAAVPSFVASVVEWVEAYTIVLAVGNTRGWRSPLWGTAAGLGTLAGIVALHDEELIYQREVAELRAQGLSPNRWDNIGFWFAYKAVLLEGLEVAFIVIALGAQGGLALQAAILGAAAAFLVTMVAGAVLHKPLSFVPENF